MFSNASEDKNHLAMLAIPVILSMIFGFAGQARANEMIRTRENSASVPSQILEEKDPERSRSEEREEGTDQEVRSGHDLLEEAIAAGDLELFLAAAKDTPFAEIMTKDAFEELVAQYKMRKEGYMLSPFISNV